MSVDNPPAINLTLWSFYGVILTPNRDSREVDRLRDIIHYGSKLGLCLVPYGPRADESPEWALAVIDSLQQHIYGVAVVSRPACPACNSVGPWPPPLIATNQQGHGQWSEAIKDVITAAKAHVNVEHAPAPTFVAGVGWSLEIRSVENLRAFDLARGFEW